MGLPEKDLHEAGVGAHDDLVHAKDSLAHNDVEVNQAFL